MTFRVGQKVICVDVDCLAPVAKGCLTKGSIYTVSWISPPGRFKLPAVWLEELGPFKEDNGFFAYRFRPIVERKTDISVFHEILRTASQQERA